MDALFFWIFAVVTIVASLLVVGQRNPMYSVLLLLVSFGALSGLYVLLNAPFMAVVQIIIYAGAIVVLFLFVVMLLNVRSEDAGVEVAQRFGIGPGPRKFGAVLAVLLAVQLIWALRRIADAPFSPMSAEVAEQTSSVKTIGLRLFGEYAFAFAFEATSVLILVAMVGAVILARKEPHLPTRKDQ